MAAFERLTLHDSRELHRRVTLALADDPVAKLLQRFVPERRQRLATFLADARRREALRAAKCCTRRHGSSSVFSGGSPR